MFQRVRKLSSKLFGEDAPHTHHRGVAAGQKGGPAPADEFPTNNTISPSSRSSSMRDSLPSAPSNELRSPKHSIDIFRKSSSKGRESAQPPVNVAPTLVQHHSHNTTVTTSRARGPAHPASSAFLSPEGSACSNSALPAVSVNTSAQPVGQGLVSPPVVGSPVSSTNARRKSMPAAVDMVLRQAEGKAYVEELMGSGNKKQMVFGQYFGAAKPDSGPPSISQAEAAAAAARHQKQATAAAAAMARPTGADKVINTVPEDAALSEAPKPAAVAASTLFAPASSPKAQAPVPRPAPPVHLAAKRVNNVESPSFGEEAQARAVCMPSTDNEPPKNRILSMAASLPNRMARKHWCLSDYVVIRKLYTGYASTVYQATCKKSLEQVALKVYHMENLCELNHYQVFREIRIHAGLQHQNIITIYCSFQEGNDIVLVQEYAEGGDLYRLLYKNGGRLSERQAVEMVLAPFLHAMQYLHTRGIIHRDIKPENVLFTENRVLKLADFGLAIDLNEERAVTRAGTLDYMSPEVLRCPPKNLPQENKNNKALFYTNSADAWAVGVFAYELIVGVAPFAGKSQLDCVDRIIHATAEFPEKTTELAKSFITAALKKHPGDRPTIMEMLHHPWIHTYKRRTSTMVPAVSRRRSSAFVPPAQLTQPLIPEQSGPTFSPGSTDMDKMSPEEIEEAIRRLQVAKNTTDVRSHLAKAAMPPTSSLSARMMQHAQVQGGAVA